MCNTITECLPHLVYSSAGIFRSRTCISLCENYSVYILCIYYSISYINIIIILARAGQQYRIIIVVGYNYNYDRI